MEEDNTVAESAGRSVWGSKLGFILAASGSAIGLGNIVFFGSNAYRYGGGAFYVPYFVALFALGIPMMIVEMGLGQTQRAAFPAAMNKTTGKKGEFFAWWSLLNAIVIAMYYITLLAWVGTMMVKSFGPLFDDGVGKTFGSVLGSWTPMVWVFIIWALNAVFLSRGTATIEKTVKVFVPLMWAFMLMLVVRGLTLKNGLQGVWYLFTPNFAGIQDASVWQGAFSQMFFSLSLGLGTMTAYASYLPRKADVVTNGAMVSFMNCGFEFVAGLAIFSMLFSFSLQPTASTLGMSFVVVPTGIGHFPAAQSLFAGMFFFLLLIAGLTSSISIIESPVAALKDKFGWSRSKSLTLVSVFGIAGSLVFALPMMLEKGGADGAPLGISLLDLTDHWAFGYSLLVVGLVEALFIGHIYGAGKLRVQLNENARFKLPRYFDTHIKYVVPALVSIVLLFVILKELNISVGWLGLEGKGFYQGDGPFDGLAWLPKLIFAVWLLLTVGGSFILTRTGGYEHEGGAS